MTPELLHLTACEVAYAAEACVPEGDEPFEGADIYWLSLDVAIDQCVRGEIADLKTEVILRRLRDHLAKR